MKKRWVVTLIGLVLWAAPTFADTFHKALTADDLHTATKWQFNNAADRLSCTAALGGACQADDIGSIAWQTDNESFWIMWATGPKWMPLGTIQRAVTNCSGEFDGVDRELCHETADDSLWLCITADECDADEWVQLVGGGGGGSAFSAVTAGINTNALRMGTGGRLDIEPASSGVISASEVDNDGDGTPELKFTPGTSIEFDPDDDGVFECTMDSNGGMDCVAHATLGGLMALKEGVDDGTDTWTVSLPDTAGGITGTTDCEIEPDGDFPTSCLNATGQDLGVVSGTAGATDDCAKWDVNGDLVSAGGACGVSGGEANTASNVGAGGMGVFKQKATLDLEFNSLSTGDFDLGSDIITLDATVARANGDVFSGVNDYGGATSLEIPNTVVGSLPAATLGLIAIVTDGANDSDCTTGAGSTQVTCMGNGSTWEPTGDAGAGGSGEVNTASNLGGGLANFDSKSVADLRFNTFAAADFDLTTNVISADASMAKATGDVHTGAHDYGGATSLEIPNTVVGSLPAATLGLIAIVTDGANDGDCVTGAGSTQVTCMGNGSTWEATGDAGAGGGGVLADLTADTGGTTTGANVTLTGGAGIATSRATDTVTIATASGETDFLASGALTCTTAQQGRMQVHTTALQYCDNTATPVLRYAAYADSAGLITDFSNAADLNASGNIVGGVVGTTELTNGSGRQIDVNHAATLTVQIEAMPVDTLWFATTGLIWEGIADDTVEGLLTWPVATSDKTITFPNSTGNVALTADSLGVPDALVCTGCIDAITEIAAGLKTGLDLKIVTGTAGATDDCAKFNADGDLVSAGAACGLAGGEANTGLSNGGGLAVYTGMTTTVLQFNSLAAADFDLTTNLFTIDDTKWAKDSELHSIFVPSAAVATDHSGYVAGHTNGANCAAGQLMAGVDAAGAVEACDATPAIDGSDFVVNKILPAALTVTMESQEWGAGSWKVTGGCAAPSSVEIPTGVPMDTVVCTDSDTARAFQSKKMPSNWDASTVLFALSAHDVTSETLTCKYDVTCQCVGDGEAFNSTFTSEVTNTEISLVFTTLVAQHQYISQAGAITCTGSCAAGDMLRWELEVDAAGSGATCNAIDLLEVSMEYGVDPS